MLSTRINQSFLENWPKQVQRHRSRCVCKDFITTDNNTNTPATPPRPPNPMNKLSSNLPDISHCFDGLLYEQRRCCRECTPTHKMKKEFSRTSENKSFDSLLSLPTRTRCSSGVTWGRAGAVYKIFCLYVREISFF